MRVLRARVASYLEEKRCIALVSTSFGRLTPYEHVWWSHRCSGPCTAKPGAVPRLLLFALNLFLLMLILLAEFGSGTSAKDSITPQFGFGALSEAYSRNRSINLDRLMANPVVIPPPSCSFTRDGKRFLKTLTLDGTCQLENSDNAPWEIDACTGMNALTGNLIDKVCDRKAVFEAFGAKPFRAHMRKFFISLEVEDRQFLSEQLRRSLPRTADLGVFVDGIARGGFISMKKSRYRSLRTRKMRCFMTWMKSPKVWILRSCYSWHNGTEIIFGTPPRLIKGKLKSRVTREKYPDVYKKVILKRTFPISPIEESIIMRKMADSTLPPPDSVLLAVAEQQRARSAVLELESSSNDQLLRILTDDIVARLLGLVGAHIGDYKINFRSKDARQVATINLYFVIPIALLLLLVLIQFAMTFHYDGINNFPHTYEEALDRSKLSYTKRDCIRSHHGAVSFRSREGNRGEFFDESSLSDFDRK